MSSAHVTSTDVVRRFKLAMQQFDEAAADGITDVRLNLQRVVDWVENDQAKYWKEQVRRGWDRIAEARLDLERCRASGVEGHEPACYDEKKALERAKRRLRHAEEQVETVRRWVQTLRHEVLEYDARVGQLTGWMESDFPKALAVLDRLTASLEAYLAIQATAGPMPVETSPADPPAGSSGGETTSTIDSADEETKTDENDPPTKHAAQVDRNPPNHDAADLP